jgi:hypothetical protein
MLSYTRQGMYWLGLALLFTVSSGNAEAATLRLNPSTGVYSVGGTFTVGVVLNTEGKAVNAADGELSFNPRELQVVSVSRAGSIFNLWTEEPAFSNSAGTVSFGGGSPAGYKGTAGNIVSVSFRPLGAGTPKVNFKSGSALAADGMGTNVLTSMNGGTYTVSAPTENPEPEYITPPNTPGAPVVTSASHPDRDSWYREKTATLAWEIPSGVTAIRTLLDSSPSTIPTIVYDELIREKTIEDLGEGVSYFHIQFKNKDGWGKITHYRLGVDTNAPADFKITEEGNTGSPERVLTFSFEDVSSVSIYKIQIDGKEPILYEDDEGTKKYTLEPLAPGYHTVIVEASDRAGNTTIATYSLTVEAFEKPIFTDYPTRINTEVIPAIKGKTRPNAKVSVEVSRAQDGVLVSSVSGSVDGDPFTVVSDDNGEFTFIPNEAFEQGVYLITAVAKDEYGRMSERSDAVRLIVERPGYITFGSYVVSALSVIIPLIALLFLAAFGSWYLWHRLSMWAKRVRKETLEAEESLSVEFNTIVKNLNAKVDALKESRKGKLTRAETELITQMEEDLKKARARIAKEVGDIEDVVT